LLRTRSVEFTSVRDVVTKLNFWSEENSFSILSKIKLVVKELLQSEVINQVLFYFIDALSDSCACSMAASVSVGTRNNNGALSATSTRLIGLVLFFSDFLFLVMALRNLFGVLE
jgi:hypothetical protein